VKVDIMDIGNYKGILAVDFDGTIVKHAYPTIGEELPDAIPTLRDLKKAGWIITIWTCRDGKEAAAALDWLLTRGFMPHAINENCVNGINYGKNKIYADYYFDDRSFPPFSGWAEVRAAFLP